MDKKNNDEAFGSNSLIKILKDFPKSKILFRLIFIIKLLPIFCVTHDWKITRKAGISFWIRKFTLSELISSVDYILILYLLLFFYTLFTCLSIIFTILELNSKKHNKNRILFIQLFSLLFTYMMSPYMFSIFTEIIIRNDSKKKISSLIYILSCVIICLNVLYICIIEILFSSVLINESFFIDNYSFCCNELGKLDFSSLFLSSYQIVIQLEFHIQLKYVIALKIVVRCIEGIYFLINYFTHQKYYYRYYIEVILRFYFSICFSSIIIEFFALLDYYKNEAFILQDDRAILYVKYVIEIFLSMLFTNIYYRFDSKYIKEDITKYNNNNSKNYSVNILKMLNLVYYMDRLNEFKNIMIELNQTFKSRVHSPKCSNENQKCFYCQKYNNMDFNKEINEYIKYSKKAKEKNGIISDWLKLKAPIFHTFLTNEIANYQYINHKWKNYYTAVLIVIIYYYMFEKNYFKCLYIIERIKGNKAVKNSYLTKLQLDLMQRKIIESYKKEKYIEKRKITSFSKEKQFNIKNWSIFSSNFNSVNKLIHIEKDLKLLLGNFRKIMKNFNEDEISFNRYSSAITQFCNLYQEYIENLKVLFNKTKCSIMYPMTKITTFFDFLIGEIPEELIQPIDNFFSNQLSSLIETDKDVYIFIIFIELLKETPHFKIKYISDDLRRKLNYSKNDFSKIELSDLFPKAFFKFYSSSISTSLENGMDYIKILNFCFQDKEKYICLFDFDGITLSTGKGLQLYIRLKDAKEQKIISKNTARKSLKNKKHNLDSNFCGSCILFTNKHGKIIAISKGFEDFFFLNTTVLNQYSINIMDIFRINKIANNGVFEINLLTALNSIEDLFMKEIGLISEDEFSKAIIKLKEFRDSLRSVNFTFKVYVNYEERFLMKDKTKKKKYYIFLINVNLDESNGYSKESGLSKLEKLFDNKFKTLTTNSHREVDYSTVVSVTVNPQVFDKDSRFWLLLKKIKTINKLGIILLRKYFKINLEKKNSEEEEKDILDTPKKKDNDDSEFMNISEMSNKNLVEYSKIKIEKLSFFQQYVYSGMSFIFYLALIYLYSEKIKKINKIHSHLYSFNDGNMYIQSICHIQFRVLLMQFVSNNIQDEILDDGYDNSWDFNNKELNLRFFDYIVYQRKYFEFVTKNKEARKYILKNNTEKEKYIIPSLDGKKAFNYVSIYDDLIHVLLLPYSLVGPIQILFNNSEYYFNEEMVEKSKYSQTDYYDSASSLISFLENFSLFYIYESNKEQNNFLNKIIQKEINVHEYLAYFILMASSMFSLYTFILFFIFLMRVNNLYASYYIGYTRLRFFNAYIGVKIQTILDYLENYSSKINIHKKIDDIEMIENNIDDFILKNIMSDQYDKYRSIKVQPFNVKKAKYFEEDNIEKVEKIFINNQNEIREMSKNYSEKKIVDSPKLFNLLRKRATQHSIVKITTPGILYEDKSPPKKKKFSQSNLNSKLTSNETKTTFTGFSNINDTSNSRNSTINRINITNNKTNIPLINNYSTNRSSLSSKSSLKLLNVSNNASQNKSVSKNNLIKEDKENSMKFKYVQNGKRLLEKPILFFNFFLILFILTVIFITISSIQIILSVQTNNILGTICNALHDIFIYAKYLNDLVFLYGLSVLKNEEIIIEFETNEWNYMCKETSKDLFSLKKHNLFKEISNCFPVIQKRVEAFSLKKKNRNYKNMIEFQNKVFSNNFCKVYAEFLSKNKNDSSIPRLEFLKEITYENLYDECLRIGNGLNVKGFNIAIESIYSTIVSYYNDFLRDKRTEKSNLERTKDKFFGTCLVELPRIFRKMVVSILINFNWDINYIKKTLLFKEAAFFVVEIIFMFISSVFYITNLKRFGNERENVEFFNTCVINSILFR